MRRLLLVELPVAAVVAAVLVAVLAAGHPRGPAQHRATYVAAVVAPARSHARSGAAQVVTPTGSSCFVGVNECSNAACTEFIAASAGPRPPNVDRCVRVAPGTEQARRIRPGHTLQPVPAELLATLQQDLSAHLARRR